MNRYLVVPFALLIIIAACSNSNNKSENTASGSGALADYNFNEFDIPLTIKGPVDAEIIEGVDNSDLDGVKTINYVLEKESFKLDVAYSIGEIMSARQLMEDAKFFTLNEEGFDSFIEEEENGFIYKLNTKKGPNYKFYYLLMKGNNPIEFMPKAGLTKFTLEQVRLMYQAAKSAQ